MKSRRNILLIAGAFALVVLGVGLAVRERAREPDRERAATVSPAARDDAASASSRRIPALAQRPAGPPQVASVQPVPSAPAQTLRDLANVLGPGALVDVAPAPLANLDLSQVATGPVVLAPEILEPAAMTPCRTVDGSGACADPLPGDHDRDGHPAASDCDDTMRDVHPGAVEVRCNGLDDDCTGGDLCPPDRDGDGDPDDLDCEPRNPLRNHRAEEVPCNGIDEDCSGSDVCDRDRDGDPIPNDCDDRDSSRHQNARDIACDGIDQDCTGNDCCDEDRDGDGHPCKSDCNDTNARIYPGAPPPERCLHADVDCDGLIDGCSRKDALKKDLAPSP